MSHGWWKLISINHSTVNAFPQPRFFGANKRLSISMKWLRACHGEEAGWPVRWSPLPLLCSSSYPTYLSIYLCYLSIYLFIYLPTWLVGGGVWSECVVLVHRDHWRCVHLFPCRSMTHTSPSIPPPPLFSVYILHCVHMSSHQTPAHWREIRSDHYISILPHTSGRI